MNIRVLLHAAAVLSRMGIALKSMLSGKYLNLRTLRLEAVDKRRKEEYVFGYEWGRGAPYGFRLWSDEGDLEVDPRHRRLVVGRGWGRGGFRFHFVTPTKCKSVVIGHDSGLCMVDGGNEVRLARCLPPGKEPLEFHFGIKVFKDRRRYLERGRRGSFGCDLAGREKLVEQIVNDIERLGRPRMSTRDIRVLAAALVRKAEGCSSLKRPNEEVKDGGEAGYKEEDVSEETEDDEEAGCKGEENVSEETEDDEEAGCNVTPDPEEEKKPEKDKKAPVGTVRRARFKRLHLGRKLKHLRSKIVKGIEDKIMKVEDVVPGKE